MEDDIIEGRLADIPYRTSPPLLFVFQQTANLAAGVYDFPAGMKAAFSPERPIRANSLYLFKTIDFAMDIDENDYLAADSQAFTFSMYQQSDAGGPALREPIPLVKYLQRTPYALSILGNELLGTAYPGQTPNSPAATVQFNRLLGSVVGTLTQTPNLLGKTDVTATILFTAQEITDDNFIGDFVKRSGRPMRPRPERAF